MTAEHSLNLSPADPDGRSSPTPFAFEWTVHPPKRGGYRRSLFLLAVVAVPYSLLRLPVHPVWALSALVALLGATNSYWLPTRYRVSDLGITRTRWFVRRRGLFADFNFVSEHPQGLLVASRQPQSRLSRRHSILLLDPPERDRLLAFLKDRVGA